MEKRPIDDPVGHPQHYIAPNGMEAIDVIESFGLGFALGNAIKYILRAGKRGERTEDLQKARWYLDREIDRSPSEPHMDLMLRGWRDCAIGAEDARDKLQAEVLHLRALITEHTEDETRWTRRQPPKRKRKANK